MVAALAATGINRLLLPAELGGYAVSPRRTVEIVEQLAAADGSTAWAAAIGFGTNHFAGYLPPDGAAEVFADPDQSNAAVFAPLTEATEAPDGTLRLTGRWPFTSNCEQAAWLGLAARFPGEPAPRLVFVPRSEVTIHPTWDVAGLRATASNDTSVADVEVHRRHTCSFADRPWPEGTLWRLPLFVVLAPTLAAVSLGVARGALDEVNRQAIGRRAQMRGSLLDDPVGMADLGAADAQLRGARAGLLASRRRVLGPGPSRRARRPRAPGPRLPRRPTLLRRRRRNLRHRPPPGRRRSGLPLQPAAAGATRRRDCPTARHVQPRSAPPPRPHPGRHRRDPPALRRLTGHDQ